MMLLSSRLKGNLGGRIGKQWKPSVVFGGGGGESGREPYADGGLLFTLHPL